MKKLNERDNRNNKKQEFINVANLNKNNFFTGLSDKIQLIDEKIIDTKLNNNIN